MHPATLQTLTALAAAAQLCDCTRKCQLACLQSCMQVPNKAVLSGGKTAGAVWHAEPLGKLHAWHTPTQQGCTAAHLPIFHAWGYRTLPKPCRCIELAAALSADTMVSSCMGLAGG